MRHSPQTGMLLLVVFWAGNFTAAKVAFTQLDPLAFTAIRFALGAVVLWGVVRILEGPTRLPRGAFWPLVVLGVIGNTLYQYCFVEGLSRTSATKSSLILAGMPAMVTLAAWLFRIERVTVTQRVAVVIATIGVVAVILGHGGTFHSGFGRGEWLLIGADVLWAAFTLLLRQWALPMSPMNLTAWTIYTGTPGLVLIGIPALLHTNWHLVSWAGWGGVLYSALLSLVVSYVLWNRGVAVLGAARTAVYNTAVPLVATVIAVIGLGERPGVAHVIGGLLIIGGVILTVRQTNDAEPGHSP